VTAKKTRTTWLRTRRADSRNARITPTPFTLITGPMIPKNVMTRRPGTMKRTKPATASTM